MIRTVAAALIPLLWASVGASTPLLEDLELSGGASLLLDVSAYAAAGDPGVQAGVRGSLIAASKWEVGGRLRLAPARPEVFVRVLAAPTFANWEPAAGFEFGVAGRDDDDGERLLRDLREESAAGVSPIYVAVHAAPLSFRIYDRFRLTALELDVGTHISPIGQVVRLNVGLITAGMSL
jgi:hypothetical protein